MIKVSFIFLAAALVGLVVQASVIHSIYPAAIAPDFILVLVVLLALRYPNAYGVLASFVLGMLADFASAQFVGPSAAGCVVAFVVVVSVSNKIFAEKSIAAIVLTFIASLVKSLVFLVMVAIYTNIILMRGDVWMLIFVEAIFSAVVAPLMLKVLSISAGGGGVAVRDPLRAR